MSGFPNDFLVDLSIFPLNTLSAMLIIAKLGPEPMKKGTLGWHLQNDATFQSSSLEYLVRILPSKPFKHILLLLY